MSECEALTDNRLRADADYYASQFAQVYFPNLALKRSPKNRAYRSVAPVPFSKKTAPKLSLIIPMRDEAVMTKRCIETCTRLAGYTNFEIIVIDNQSQEVASKTFFAQIKKIKQCRVIAYPHPFNYSAMMNLGVQEARGEVIVLLNNDIEAIEQGWLAKLVGYLKLPEVAVVGAKLLYENRMVQHSGVYLTQNGNPDHAGLSLHADDAGHFYLNQIPAQHCAVTAACMAFWKKEYVAVGGMDAVKFPVAFNDVDLCMRMGRAGRQIVKSGVGMLHLESVSRGRDRTGAKALRLARELGKLAVGLN